LFTIAWSSSREPGRRDNAARKCMDLVDDGTVRLCLSADVLAEIDDVLHIW
jgi:hypothetical protein